MEWCAQQRNQLARSFIDHDELRIFETGRPGHPRRGRNANGYGKDGQRKVRRQDPRRRKQASYQSPDKDGCQGSPGSRSRAQAASAKESCYERGP